MSELAIPKVDCVECTDKLGRFVSEPMERGFGTTIGNALRRVLLGYLPGAAVVIVRIDGIQHEFSSIPNVKEDTIEFLLNLKGLRLRSLTGNEGKLTLTATGPGAVHASDIAPSADFKIVNPELYLLTLDSAAAPFVAELDVALGVGYRSPESTEGMPIGSLPLDAIFTPVRKVNFTTEPVHVGRETSLERMKLEVWTDGTITPQEAVSQATEILIRQLEPFISHGVPPPAAESKESISYIIPAEQFNLPIEQLDLSVRAVNCLRHAGISTVGEVMTRGTKELLTLRNFGQKSLTELEERLQVIGLSLTTTEEKPEPAEEPVEPKKDKKGKAAASATE